MIRWLLLTIVMIYAAMFSVYNLDTVRIKLPLVQEIYHIELAIIVLISLALGILVWAIISMFSSFEQRSKFKKLERHNKELKEELNRLRNLSVLDDHELYGKEESHVDGPDKSEGTVVTTPEIRSNL
jgi:uncharacterized integral membrane protein